MLGEGSTPLALLRSRRNPSARKSAMLTARGAFYERYFINTPPRSGRQTELEMRWALLRMLPHATRSAEGERQIRRSMVREPLQDFAQIEQ